MYPHHHLTLFPPFPHEPRIFVAMSFDSRFDSRWQNVIAPAIRGVGLEPSRVDTRMVSDSVITEILDGIAKCCLVFADMTTIGKLGDTTIRNGNVMYEIGIAHSCRLPEEVLIFRSDEDALPFDVTNIRVNKYDPDRSPKAAKSIIEDAIKNARREIDLTRHLAVKKAMQSLDHVAWRMLDRAFTNGSVRPFPMGSVANALSNAPRNSAITRLLQLGLLETDLETRSREFIRDNAARSEVRRDENFFLYRLTPLGRIVRERLLEKVGRSALIETVKKIAWKAKFETQSGKKPDSEAP